MQAAERVRVYDFEERSYLFAKRVRALVKRMPRILSNLKDGKQLVRSSGSVGSDYIEANEPLGEKDFLIHMKISRKESKESRYWLRLLDLDGNEELEVERRDLIQEAHELMHIFNAIIRKRSA